MTALHANSKSDTILLCDSDVGDIFEDYGPERTDLTDQTTYIEESPSARSAIGSPRNICLKVDMETGWSGTLIELGNAGANSYAITMAGDALRFSEAGLLRVSVDVPALSGVNSIVLINWSQRTEGVKVYDDVLIVNITNSKYAFGFANHTAATPVSTDTLTVSAAYGGADPYSGTITAVRAIHIGRRFHTATEAAEDWIAASSAPTFTGYARAPMLTDEASNLTIGSDGALAGPSYLLAGSATVQAGQRNVGPFVNLVINTPTLEGMAPSPGAWYRATPDGVAGWQWCIRYLWHGYLSPKVNVAQVRVQVATFDLFGGGTISPVHFRSYSISDLPINGKPGALTYYVGPIVSKSTTSDNTGTWLDLGTVRLARDATGRSFFALGFFPDSAVNEGITFSTLWRVNAITVDPYAKDLSAGGVGGDIDEVAP